MSRPNPNTVALLERARALCEPPTWYQVGKLTGIKHQTLSRVHVHGKTLGDVNAWKLAKFLGMDPKEVMAYMAEDRAQDEPTKEFWTRQLPRLLSAAAIALALSFGARSGALAADIRSVTGTGPVTLVIYYAKLPGAARRAAARLVAQN